MSFFRQFIDAENPTPEVLEAYISGCDDAGIMKIISKKEMVDNITSATIDDQIKLKKLLANFYFLGSAMNDIFHEIMREEIPDFIRSRLCLKEKKEKKTQKKINEPSIIREEVTNQEINEGTSRVPLGTNANVVEIVESNQETLRRNETDTINEPLVTTSDPSPKVKKQSKRGLQAPEEQPNDERKKIKKLKQNNNSKIKQQSIVKKSSRASSISSSSAAIYDRDIGLHQVFWKSLNDYKTWAQSVDDQLLVSREDPNNYTKALVHTLALKVEMLEQKLAEMNGHQDLTKFNQKMFISKDGYVKSLEYRIKKANGQYVTETQMKSEFLEMMKKVDGKWACKGTPNCGHEPLGKAMDRSNKLHDHLREVLGWVLECASCHMGNHYNKESFIKHLKKAHFDNIENVVDVTDDDIDADK